MSIPYTWVYLIFDPFTQLFKIGRSDTPQERYNQLCNDYGTIPAAPTNYQLIQAWLAPDYMEKALHDHFSDCRVRGEWFDLAKFKEKKFTVSDVELYFNEIMSNGERLNLESCACCGGEPHGLTSFAEQQLWQMRRRCDQLNAEISLLTAELNQRESYGYYEDMPRVLNPAPAEEVIPF